MQRKNKNKNKQRRAVQNASPASFGGLTVGRELSDGLAYAGQQFAMHKIPGSNVKLTTTVTTGVVAQTYAVSSDNITGFNTRFSNTYDEYRIVGADFKLIPLGANAGEMNFWFDEKSAAAPTANMAAERICRQATMNSGSPKSTITMKWRARDLLDLQYSPIGTGVNPVIFKAYTDNTNY
jgi:hypothetical protein